MTFDSAVGDTAASRDPVEELAEAFLERYRRGERPSLSEFIARAPEHADEIRELFPALVLMERASPVSSGPSARMFPIARMERIGEYRIIREVGRGGMGIVYEAEQEALGRHVALKVLSAAAAGDAHCLLRFRREARAAAQLHHTNIVPVHDIGERDGVHFYAMQFIQGQGLDEVIAELKRLRKPPGQADTAGPPVADERLAPSVAASLAEGVVAGRFAGEAVLTEGASGASGASPEVEPSPSDPEGKESSSSVLNERSEFSTKSDFHYFRSVARIGLQIADALGHAHAQRVLHRDIKPSNLLLDARGTVWVADFGLAKEEGDDLTRTGDVVGTLRYMAPERFRGVSDPRSDIYSLGLTLYELLTLRPAFPETDRVRLAHAITHQEPREPRTLDSRVPRDLETIVLKAIAKEPAGRYATAWDLEEDLRRFLADRAILARRTSAWERMRRWCRRNPGWAATAATVFLLLVIMALGGSLLSWHLRRALNDVQTADREKTEKLWQSYLDRARALRSSRRIGRRFEALEAIREAARIRVTPELRDEAVAALALADVELVREWRGFPEGTSSCSYDATFSRYARLDYQGCLTVCRLGPSGEQIIARLPAPGPVHSNGMGMSPDGRFVVHGYSEPGAGGAGKVRVWKLDGPAPRVCLDEPRGMKISHALSFHPDGRRLAIGHTDQTVGIYDLETDAPPRRLALDQVPESLAFHPRDGRLAIACGESIRLFDTETGRELPALRHAQIKTWWYGLAWHPDGRLLAATSEDRKIHLWDTESAKEAAAPLEGHTSSGIFMTFNDDGSRLFSAGWDRQARLWDTVSGELLLTIPGRFDAWLSRDGTLIGPERKGTMLRLWRVADGRALRSLRNPRGEPDEQLDHPVLHADGKVLAASSNRSLNFFDLDSGRALASIPTTELGTACPKAFDRRDGWMTSGSSGVLLWPARYDPARPGVLHVGPPRKVASTIHSGSAASRDGRIRAVPLGTQTLVLDRDRPGRRLLLGPQYDVRHGVVSPDGRWVVTCSWWTDGQSPDVRTWEADSGRHVVDLPAGGMAQGLFSPDGRWLVVQSQDQACRLWEVDTWRAGRRFEGTGACWTPDGRLLAVNDVIGVIRLVEPASGREVLRLTGPHLAWDAPACFTPDGTRLIAAAADCRAFDVWDLRSIRTQLRALGMDWDLPEFPPAAGPRGADVAPTVEVDLGIPRQPVPHPTP